jgi:GNAT superfamily N-acetyltransferase
MKVRPRRREDIAALADVLMDQQPDTRYPFRDPLPMPVEQFLHADDAVAAWTAEVDGHPAGHVCRVGPLAGFPGATEMNRACATAHGCAVEQLAWVSKLFVGREARGTGLGRMLLGTVLDDIREAGLFPCLQVLPTHEDALSLYESTGWREVMRVRPEWLTRAAGDAGPDVLVMVLSWAGDHPAR